MKFELEPNNRNIPDGELIQDVIKVAKSLGKETITRKEYDQHGRFSEGTLRKRFNGWSNVQKKAGLNSTKDYEVTDEQLLAELKRISELPDIATLSRIVFNKYKRISNTTTIERRFGSWSAALKKAGVTLSSMQKRYSDEELYENLLTVWATYGKQPPITAMDKSPSRISSNTYSNRFGNWRKTLESFVEYMNNGSVVTELKTPPSVDEQVNTISTLKTTKTTNKAPRNINLRLRFHVLTKDHFKCRVCGKAPATDHKTVLHVDHIVPWSKGGETILENLQTLCQECNLGKGNWITS